MEKLGIYEYVAVVVPGVAFLFGLGVIVPNTEVLHAILLPQDLGAATVHLVLAFAIGHMLQVVGQLAHEYYWTDFGGLPTDWPFTRQHSDLSPDLQDLVADALGQEAEELVEWRRSVATARTLITSAGLARRLETFQANYGMFRSLAVTGLLLIFITPWSTMSLSQTCPVLFLLIVVSMLGMHRFGIHYARELFAAVRAWMHAEPNSGPFRPHRAPNPERDVLDLAEHRSVAVSSERAGFAELRRVS